MKEVGEQLLNVMRTALEAKRAGKRGNYQGVLNNTRHIFDTTLRQASGAFPDLKPMIVEAQRIQTEGARINGPAKSAGGGSRSINLADAFDFQQKKRQAKNLNVAEEEAQPKKKQPTIQEQESDTEIETVQVPDPDLISHLGAMTPAKLRDYFGGMDGARIFAQEMFHLEQGEDQNDTNFLSAVLRRINGLKKEANV
jgi:hypothetical protein